MVTTYSEASRNSGTVRGSWSFVLHVNHNCLVTCTKEKYMCTCI